MKKTKKISQYRAPYGRAKKTPNPRVLSAFGGAHRTTGEVASWLKVARTSAYSMLQQELRLRTVVRVGLTMPTTSGGRPGVLYALAPKGKEVLKAYRANT